MEQGYCALDAIDHHLNSDDCQDQSHNAGDNPEQVWIYPGG